MRQPHLVVYQGRDNTEELVLLADDAPADVTAITRIVLVIGAVTIDSQLVAGAITWPVVMAYKGAPINGVKLALGAAGLAAGNHAECRLTVYDPLHPNGLVWTDGLSVRVKT